MVPRSPRPNVRLQHRDVMCFQSVKNICEATSFLKNDAPSYRNLHLATSGAMTAIDNKLCTESSLNPFIRVSYSINSETRHFIMQLEIVI